MTRLHAYALTVALFVPAASLASEYSDYRIPRHTVKSLETGVRLSGSSFESHASAVVAASGKGRFGALSLSGGWALDSDPLQYKVSFSGGSSLSSSSRAQTQRFEVADHILSSHNDDRSRFASQDLRLVAGMRSYPWALPIGIDVVGAGAGRYRQAWTTSTREDEDVSNRPSRRFRSDDNAARWDYDYLALASNALGVGRVRDATPLYDAGLLERRLLALGTLTRPLSPAARARLVALYAIAVDYAVVHDRPSKFQWRDIEQVLRDDGALAGSGIDAYGLYRILERYQSVRRTTGWFAGLGFTGVHQHAISRSTSHRHQVAIEDTLRIENNLSNSSYGTTSTDVWYFGVQAEAHRPIGYRWQLDGQSQVGWPTRHPHNGLSAQTSARAAYTIADRWSATGWVAHGRTIRGKDASVGSFGTSDWQFSLGVEVDYYLEDHLELRLSARSDQGAEESTIPDPALRRRYRREDGIALGLSYRFLGSAQAPGVIEPMGRLAPQPIVD